MLAIDFAPPALPTHGALAAIVEDGAAPTALFAEADRAAGGQIGRALAAAGFKPGNAEVCTILAPGALTRFAAIGLGPAGRSDTGLQAAGARAALALAREETAALDASALSAAQAAEAAFGAVLRAYRFTRYRTREKPEDKPRLATLTVFTPHPAEAAAAFGALRHIAAGVFMARDLASEPPNVLTPAEFARRIETLSQLGLEIEILGPEQLRQLRFGALLGVAQGSANEPRVAILRWQGAGTPEAAPLAFIGKGVTFDSGGISIKAAQGMEDMKWDMAGAGAVVGAMAALAGRGAKLNAVGAVGLVENMPSGTAQRPSDIVTTASGQTVEIINTDAEGRMVLADVLWYTQDRFKPHAMVDLATLTGAMVTALGHEHAGLFSSTDDLASRLLAAGEAVEEKLWRLPLGEAYDKQLKSDIADLKHVTGRPGSAITAACFLQRFTNGVPWAHLDIAGTAWTGKDLNTVPKGATGFGVRLLDRLAASFET